MRFAFALLSTVLLTSCATPPASLTSTRPARQGVTDIFGPYDDAAKTFCEARLKEIDQSMNGKDYYFHAGNRYSCSFPTEKAARLNTKERLKLAAHERDQEAASLPVPLEKLKVLSIELVAGTSTGCHYLVTATGSKGHHLITLYEIFKSGWLRPPSPPAEPPVIDEADRLPGKDTCLLPEDPRKTEKGWPKSWWNAISKGEIMVGMSPKAVEYVLGRPTTINASGGAHGSSEQHVYRNSNTYLYYRSGKLTSWQFSR